MSEATFQKASSGTSAGFGQDLDLNAVVDDMFMVLTDKEKEVVIRRYSLNAKPKETLEKIGKSFSVTRERIRQIENTALAKLRRTVDNTKLRIIIRKAKEILSEHDGLLLEKRLINEVLQFLESKARSEVDGNIIRLALSIDEEIMRLKKSTEYFPAWRTEEIREKSVDDVSKVTIKYLNTQSEVVPENELARIVQKNLTKRESLKFIRSCFEVNRLLKKIDGGWGLMTWRHINPKSIRDKAYIVLKRYGKPLHFVEITNKITEAEFDHKVVTVQAVHNELIRDEKFVLVGRGLYALKEWGYVEGTVSDVIERILRKAKKPLTKTEIVKKVLEVRDVKIGTIALNLQKNPQFIRVGRAVYTLHGGAKK